MGKNEKKKKSDFDWGTLIAFIFFFLLLGFGFFMAKYDDIQKYFKNKEKQEKELVLKEKIAEFNQACEKEDFEKAYSLLSDIQVDADLAEYLQCKQKVVKREALYLLAQDNEQSAKRLVMLLSQYLDDYEKSKLIEELIQMAEKIDNQYVLELLKDEVKE